MVLYFFCCIIVKILNLNDYMQLMQKSYLFSMQIGKPQANALKSIGYTDSVLFLSIGKPDIYQHKSLCKSVADFYPCDQLLLAADLPNPAYQYPAMYIYRITNSRKEYCIRISYRISMQLQEAFLFAQEIGKFFALTALDLLK
jgi:hypothetical protein